MVRLLVVLYMFVNWVILCVHLCEEGNMNQIYENDKLRTIICHELITWLYVYVSCLLWVWLWLWFSWLDQVSHFNTYIKFGVTFWHTYICQDFTFQHIYWIECHVLIHQHFWCGFHERTACDYYYHIYLSLILWNCMLLLNDNWIMLFVYVCLPCCYFTRTFCLL